MPDEEEVARRELRRVADDLESIHYRLQGIHGSLPVSEREEVMLLGEEDPDFPTEARAVIECVLADWISTAVRDLRTLAEYPAEEEG